MSLLALFIRLTRFEVFCLLTCSPREVRGPAAGLLSNFCATIFVIVHDRLYERSLPPLSPDPMTQLAIATAFAELATEVLRVERLWYEIMLKKGGQPPVAPLLEHVIKQASTRGGGG